MLSLARLRGLPATSRVRVCDTCTVYENDTAGRVERVFQHIRLIDATRYTTSTSTVVDHDSDVVARSKFRCYDRRRREDNIPFLSRNGCCGPPTETQECPHALQPLEDRPSARQGAKPYWQEKELPKIPRQETGLPASDASVIYYGSRKRLY